MIDILQTGEVVVMIFATLVAGAISEGRLKVHRYIFWKIERVIRICLKVQNLFKDLFWAKWNKKNNMSPGFLRFYDVF